MDGMENITAAFARMATLDRPFNRDAEPVRIPAYWRDHSDVRHFFDRHKMALTWDQVDHLVATFDRLKANPAPEAPPEAKTEDALTAGWRETCAATSSDSERARRMAKHAARILGAEGPPQIRRVHEMYTRHGMKATHQAVIQIMAERLDVESRFKFLEHRIKTNKEWSA